MRPPEIENSTREEEQAYINEHFHCKWNCDICGFCVAFHGKTADIVLVDYVEGKESFMETTSRNR